MNNAVNIYTTPSGRVVRIPDELLRTAKFTKDGQPDKRIKGNAAFVAWAEAQDAAPMAEDEVDAVVDADLARAQDYASRVWAGQSPSESRTWRLERVRLALEGQGLSMDGVVL